MLVRHGSPGLNQRKASVVFMGFDCSKHSQMEIYTCTQNARPFGIEAQMFSFHATTHVHIGSTCDILYAVTFFTISYVCPWEFMHNWPLSRVKYSSASESEGLPAAFKGLQVCYVIPLLDFFSLKFINELFFCYIWERHCWNGNSKGCLKPL